MLLINDELIVIRGYLKLEQSVLFWYMDILQNFEIGVVDENKLEYKIISLFQISVIEIRNLKSVILTKLVVSVLAISYYFIFLKFVQICIM